MITNNDQFENQDSQEMTDEDLKPARFGSPADGYQPDEDDPAWPSRSGQAD